MYYDLLARGFIKEEDREPDSGHEFHYYLDALRELGTARPQAMSGLSPIPFTAIAEYSNLFEVDDFQAFFRIIRKLDGVMIEQHAERAAKEKPKNV